MQVILFYALLIGGIALGVAAYLAFLVTPIILVGVSAIGFIVLMVVTLLVAVYISHR